MKARFSSWVPICDPWTVGMEKILTGNRLLPEMNGLVSTHEVSRSVSVTRAECVTGLSSTILSVLLCPDINFVLDEPVQGSSIIGVRLGRSGSSGGLIGGPWPDIGTKAQRALSKPLLPCSLSSPESLDHLVHSSLYYHFWSFKWPQITGLSGQRSEEQAFSTFTLWVFGLVAKSDPALTTLCTVALRFLCPWDFLGKNAGVGCHFLLQWIFAAEWFSSLGACPGYCRMFSCLPGLYPLDASGTSWSKLFPGVVKCPPEGRGQNLAVCQTAEALCSVWMRSRKAKAWIMRINSAIVYRDIFACLYVSLSWWIKPHKTQVRIKVYNLILSLSW